jgi:hypothetical protein
MREAQLRRGASQEAQEHIAAFGERALSRLRYIKSKTIRSASGALPLASAACSAKKSGTPFAPFNYGFAVDHGRAELQRREGLSNPRHPRGPVEPAFRVDARRAASNLTRSS